MGWPASDADRDLALLNRLTTIDWRTDDDLAAAIASYYQTTVAGAQIEARLTALEARGLLRRRGRRAVYQLTQVGARWRVARMTPGYQPFAEASA